MTTQVTLVSFFLFLASSSFAETLTNNLYSGSEQVVQLGGSSLTNSYGSNYQTNPQQNFAEMGRGPGHRGPGEGRPPHGGRPPGPPLNAEQKQRMDSCLAESGITPPAPPTEGGSPPAPPSEAQRAAMRACHERVKASGSGQSSSSGLNSAQQEAFINCVQGNLASGSSNSASAAQICRAQILGQAQ